MFRFSSQHTDRMASFAICKFLVSLTRMQVALKTLLGIVEILRCGAVESREAHECLQCTFNEYFYSPFFAAFSSNQSINLCAIVS